MQGQGAHQPVPTAPDFYSPFVMQAKNVDPGSIVVPQVHRSNDIAHDQPSHGDADGEIEQEVEGAEKQENDHKENEIDTGIPLVYPIEIFIFSLIGWAWLSLREMIGNTPVLDAGIIISLVIIGTVNLIASTMLPDKNSFRPWAKSFAGYVVSLWILYIYALVESIGNDGKMTLCCDGGVKKDGMSFSKAQAAVFYGGLPFHQIFAVTTFVFLSVVMFVSLLQVKANYVVRNSTLRNWLPRETWASSFVLILIHVVMFTSSPLTCKKYFELVVVVITLTVLIWLLMVNIAWIMIMIMVAKKRAKPYSQSFFKKIELIWFVVDFGVSLISLLLAFVLISVLGQRVSPGLLVLILMYLLWSVITIVQEFNSMKAHRQAEKAAAETRENSMEGHTFTVGRFKLDSTRGVFRADVKQGRTKKLR